ncbi:hypothetical protein BGZ50_001446 [Haplosporangium sp. Z 11]|nr:hypothetical protein BGZ50_001446 [Haplosporangium sp. Z 11]
MDNNDDRSSLLPVSLLSTSVFERTKRINPQSPPHPSTLTSIPTPLAIRSVKVEPTEERLRMNRRPSYHEASTPVNQQRIEMDPFVQGQSRHGRQYYEGSSRRPHEDDPNDRHARKRRIGSLSPEPRKKTAGPGIEDQGSRRQGSTMAMSPISSPDSGMYDQERDSRRRADREHIGSLSNKGREEMQVHSPANSKSSHKSGVNSTGSRTHKRHRKRASDDSSSSSSTSSDSDSSSEDSDAEDQSLAGFSALKLHGIIHDLMLELERTRTKHARYCEKVKESSKKIRDISKKLERRFRDLSEGTMSERSSHTRVPSSVKPSGDRPASFPSTSSSVSSSSRVPHSTVMMPTASAAPLADSKRLSLPSRLAAYDDRVRIASADVVETLTNVHADVRNKAFARKPRSMILHTSVAGPDMEEVMVTSALDGSINFWDLENRRVMSTIPKGSLSQPWAEDMCWVGRNVLAVASATKDGVPNNHQLALVHIKKTMPQRYAPGMGGPSVNWTLQTLEQKPHDSSKGGIMCMTSLANDPSDVSLATAAMDKQIIHWKFRAENSEGECVPIQQKLIHNKHTSTIQALSYSPQNRTLYSGGSDCKIVAWDMARSHVLFENRNVERGRINSIVQNPVDPNLLLVCHANTNNQLALHDTRQRFQDPVLRFGFQCADNLSRQVMPSWHPNGAIVSCGTQSEAKINIWDVRWKDVQRGAGQSIDVHEKRVFKAAFHPRRSFMTSMSADSSLAFIDFRLNPGTVVHG